MSDQTTLLGALSLGSITLLGGVMLLLRLREYLAENPDPKLTYATLAELEKLRHELNEHRRDTKADNADIHRLIRQNAEHIAALIAQSEFYNQRITELSRHP